MLITESAASTAVSVVIPAYNAAATLHQTVMSALRQSHPPLEVIVIDDGSADETHDIALSLAAAHRTVRVHQQLNRGVACSRNEGLRRACGKFLVFLDADDLMLPHMLERLIGEFQPGVVLVGGDARYAVSLGHRVGGRVRSFARFNEQLARRGELMPFQPSAAVVLATAARSIGGFDERLSAEAAFPEDLDFFARLANVGRLVAVNDVVSLYALSSGSKSWRDHAGTGSSSAETSLLRGEAFVRKRLEVGELQWDSFVFSPSSAQRRLLRSRFAARAARTAWLQRRFVAAIRAVGTAVYWRMVARYCP